MIKNLLQKTRTRIPERKGHLYSSLNIKFTKKFITVVVEMSQETNPEVEM